MEGSDTAADLLVRESYADQVYHHIKGMILSGQLRQGERIVEERIAEKFGVSRTPIREALTRLEAYGLVELQSRRNAQVVRIDRKGAYDLGQLRLYLEQMSFRLLCNKGDRSAFDRLRTIADAAREKLLQRDRAGYLEADLAFHQTAADLCGNAQFAQIFRHFECKAHLLYISQRVPLGHLEVCIQQHFDLIDLLETGRCTAVDELLKDHIARDLESYGDNGHDRSKADED